MEISVSEKFQHFPELVECSWLYRAHGRRRSSTKKNEAMAGVPPTGWEAMAGGRAGVPPSHPRACRRAPTFASSSRRVLPRCAAFNFRRSKAPEHSERAHREVVLFLAQRELESAFQRLVNMEMYEEARQVASQQEKLQEIVNEESSNESSSGTDGQPENKGLGGLLGLRRQSVAAENGGEASERLDDGEVVVKLLSLRTELQRAIDSEDYERASLVRDEILAVERDMENQRKQESAVVRKEPKYALGQCVVHWRDGWTGVVCGLQQDTKTRKVKNVDERTSEEVDTLVYSYHVLPSSQYWAGKRGIEGACVALVEEDDLNAPQPPATWRSVHGSDKENFLVSHPYMYLLFLGQDGEGNYVPSKKLRDKFGQQRRDVYWNGGRGGDGDGSDDK